MTIPVGTGWLVLGQTINTKRRSSRGSSTAFLLQVALDVPHDLSEPATWAARQVSCPSSGVRLVPIWKVDDLERKLSGLRHILSP